MSDELCRLCGHPMSAHDELDLYADDPAYADFAERYGIARYSTVCTQGCLAPVDASPWDHVCGCVWAHDEPRNDASPAKAGPTRCAFDDAAGKPIG